MKQELNRRTFPNIDEALHCVAVKAHDELKLLYRKDVLTPADVKMLSDLTDLLLLVRKSTKPGKFNPNVPKPGKKSVSTQTTDNNEDLLG